MQPSTLLPLYKVSLTYGSSILAGVLQGLILGRKMHYTAVGAGRDKNPKDRAAFLHSRFGTCVHLGAAKSGKEGGAS